MVDEELSALLVILSKDNEMSHLSSVCSFNDDSDLRLVLGILPDSLQHLSQNLRLLLFGRNALLSFIPEFVRLELRHLFGGVDQSQNSFPTSIDSLHQDLLSLQVLRDDLELINVAELVPLDQQSLQLLSFVDRSEFL
jgi:hypothetical protein